MPWIKNFKNLSFHVENLLALHIRTASSVSRFGTSHDVIILPNSFPASCVFLVGNEYYIMDNGSKKNERIFGFGKSGIMNNTAMSVEQWIKHYFVYCINTNEIPGELSHQNMISPDVKITCYLHTWKDNRCYGYTINGAFHCKKLLVKWFGIFHKCLYNK